jgi:hypothetical protein
MEVLLDPLQGRCAAATRDLQPGVQILTIEPVAAVVEDELASSCCSWCFSDDERKAYRPCAACGVQYYCR